MEEEEDDADEDNPCSSMYRLMVSAFHFFLPGRFRGAGNFSAFTQFRMVFTWTPIRVATSAELRVAAVWIALICFAFSC